MKGKRILITRAREQSGEFASLLKKLGAEVIEFPTIEIRPPLHWKELDNALQQLHTYDWLIFTSANGVHFFWQRWGEKLKDHPLPSSLKICAIGPATADQLKKRGIPVHFVPKEYIAEAILKGFKKKGIRGKRILLARAENARDVLPMGLKKMGAGVDVVVAYRTVKPKAGAKKLKGLLTNRKVEVITFTSSSTVNHFVELLKKEDLQNLLKGKVVACIGPVTSKTARAWGIQVQIQPKQYTIGGLVQAIALYFENKGTNSIKNTSKGGGRDTEGMKND